MVMDTRIITAPASKSLSHRMLIGAALASGTSSLHNILESDDLARTADILRGAGAIITPQGTGLFLVQGVAGKLQGDANHPLSCDVHESGTTCRLLTAVLASGQGLFRIHGAPRMHQRPMGSLLQALRSAGISVQCEAQEGYLPLILRASSPTSRSISIGLEQSSQYLSGLLLAAPQWGGMTIATHGSTAVSWPYVGLTLQAMEDFGLTFVVEKQESHTDRWQAVDWRAISQIHPGTIRFVVPTGSYRAGNHEIEGDWSGASYFLAAGALGPNPVTVRGLRRDSLQGDRAILDILKRMGALVTWQGNAVTVSPAPLTGITVDMGHCPDLVPTVAVLAAFAQGTTTIHNVAHLRIKECDRLAAPAQELHRAGITCAVAEAGMTIQGTNQKHLSIAQDTVFNTYGDHRMAMSLALLSLRGASITMNDPHCVSKSFPAFWEHWHKVLPCV